METRNLDPYSPLNGSVTWPHPPYLLDSGGEAEEGDGYLNDSFLGNMTNSSIETPTEAPSQAMALWQAVILIIVCTIIIVSAVVGNALVCLSVALVKKLQTPSNLLIVSLAISDFSVGLFVMPFSVMYSVSGNWLLGTIACKFWVSADVLLCTASILNLCAISIDRYFVITRPFKYAVKRTPRRMFCTIACVWALSFFICAPPLIISPLTSNETIEAGTCEYSSDLAYQIYATFSAFYIPLGVMIFVYYRIYVVSQKKAKEEAKSKPSCDNAALSSSGLITPLRRDSGEDHLTAPNHGSYSTTNGRLSAYKHSIASKSSSERIYDVTPERGGRTRRRRSAEDTSCCGLRLPACIRRSKLKGKESKATKTLGVIMGTFIACWLPFFILQLLRASLGARVDWIPKALELILYWLGYANSSLNPLIYARFNREFRQPFKEILMCRCRTINNRIRMNTFTEQYGVPNMQSRHSLKPPQASVVKYDSHGQTIVKLGNGNSLNNNGNKL